MRSPLGCLPLVLILFVPSIARCADWVALRTGYGQMYNLRFGEAHRVFDSYEHSYPEDPLGPVSNAAAFLFSEFNRLGILQSQFLTDDRQISGSKPLTQDATATRNFEAALGKAARLIEAAEKKNAGDPGARLAQVLQLGLHADYLALVQKRDLSALNEIKRSRQLAQQLVNEHPGYEDAYIAMGVENYLLSQKAAPVRWILRATGAQTDAATGVRQLCITADKGELLSPYAKVLLAIAALRRGDKREVKEQLTWLAANFPGNPLYRNELGKLK